MSSFIRQHSEGGKSSLSSMVEAHVKEAKELAVMLFHTLQVVRASNLEHTGENAAGRLCIKPLWSPARLAFKLELLDRELSDNTPDCN